MEVILELVKVEVSLVLARKVLLAEASAMSVLSVITNTRVVLVQDVVPKCKGLTFR